MDSQRRQCETSGPFEHIDADIDDVIQDLESWRQRASKAPLKFELVQPADRVPLLVRPATFVADIQQMMNLFDRSLDESSETDIENISHSFSFGKELENTATENCDGPSSEASCWTGKSDYFKAKNPSELFKLNQSFIDEVKQSKNHFALSCVGDRLDVVNSCWGIASAMNFMLNRRVAIVGEKTDTDYAAFVTDAEKKELHLERYDIRLPYIEKGGISLFSIFDFVDVIYNLSPQAVQGFLQEFSQQVGIVFWDLPRLSDVETKRHLYVPIFETISSISFVVNPGDDRKQLSRMVKYYQRYNIPILGMIFGKNDLDL